MAAKTSRLGNNPLRAHAGTPPQIIPTEPPPEPAIQAEPEAEKIDRLNLYLPASLAAYTRDVCYALGREYTLGDLVAEALPAYFAELEKERNNGEPFPPRPTGKTRLRPGRPIR